MYHMKSYNLEQENISVKLSKKFSVDISIGWLNPLFDKCYKRLNPDMIL